MDFWRKKEDKTKAPERETKPEVLKNTAPAKDRGDVKKTTGIINRPHITEKTSALEKSFKYVFSVSRKATKPEIKKAVRDRYGVQVRTVNILNSKGKERRRARQVGWRPGFKKAIVTLKDGETVEIQ